MKTKHKLLAFTLVEVMIVVAMLGLLAAIIVPSFVRASRISELKQKGLLPCDANSVSAEQLDKLWKIAQGTDAGQVVEQRAATITEPVRFTITTYADGVEVIRDNQTGQEYLGRSYGSVGYGLVLMPKTNALLEKE